MTQNKYNYKRCKECYKIVLRSDNIFCDKKCKGIYKNRPFAGRGINALKMENTFLSDEDRQTYEQGVAMMAEYRHSKEWGIV